MRLILAALVLAGAVAGAAGADGPVPAFDMPGPVETTEGHATLSWSLPAGASAEGVTFRLEESEDGAFAEPLVRYEGPDRAAFVSGLHEGVTRYRVRARTSAGEVSGWSQVLEVRTTYPPSGRVTLLMIVGGVVFVSTVGAVVVGHVLHGREVG